MKEKVKKLTDQIAEDIKRVAKELGIEPYEMNKVAYFSNGQFSEWEVRKCGGLINLRNTYFAKDEEKDLGEVVTNRELRRKFNLLQRELGELEAFKRDVQEILEEMPEIKLKPYVPKNKHYLKKEPRTLNLALSDLHIGSDLTVEQNDIVFGPVEEARALALVVKNVCNYKKEYRDQTELVVNVLGDVIENELHGASSSEYLHIQTCRAMWVIAQAIGRFSESFPKVRVNFCVGNHGRDISVHHKRATDIKFNAMETTIYFGVRLSCQHLKNVEFNQPKTPWISYTAQGHKTYATHGDTNLTPGNIGNTVNIRNLENQTNKINSSLSNRLEYKVFCVGHVHQAMVTALPNGSTLVINGALIPPNSFAQSLNIMESQQVQVMWETTPEHPVGDFRFICVNDSARDSSLDSIIHPFEG